MLSIGIENDDWNIDLIKRNNFWNRGSGAFAQLWTCVLETAHSVRSSSDVFLPFKLYLNNK